MGEAWPHVGATDVKGDADTEGGEGAEAAAACLMAWILLLSLSATALVIGRAKYLSGPRKWCLSARPTCLCGWSLLQYAQAYQGSKKSDLGRG